MEARVGATKGVESQCLAGTAHCRYRSLAHKRWRTSIRAPIKQCERSSASSSAKQVVPAKDLSGECTGVWLTWVEECRERRKASSRS